MPPDPIKSLLQQADSSSEPTLLPSGEMARRVEGALRRQQQRRATAVAVVIPVVFGVIGLTAWRHQQNAAPMFRSEPAIAIRTIPTTAEEQQSIAPQSDEVERALQELAELEAEANFHRQLAQRMIDDRERDVTLALARQALTEEEPAETVRQRLDLVAYRMIARADRLRSEPHPKQDPTEIYREVVRLFPATESAAEARLRLAEIHPVHPPGGA